MKRALIITYYWPPSGGSGVQRWLKFAKYLPEFGWKPVIYTPSNPESPALDYSLMGDIPQDIVVLNRRIIEPYTIYRGLSKKKGGVPNDVVNPINHSGRKNWKQKLSLWVRANLFIPDPRIFWVRSSANYLINYLKTDPVDVIISTGPPHSMHLIAKRVHKRMGIKWVADFRDPWTRIFYFKHLPMLPTVRRLHYKLEKSVLKGADVVISVTDQIIDELAEGVACSKKFHTISNGYDDADYINVKDVSAHEHFSFLHTGLFSSDGNPKKLWKVLSDLVKEDSSFNEKLRILLVGKIDKEVLDSINSAGLQTHTQNLGYLPHSEISTLQKSSWVLLLPLREEPESKGILTGKFFEYLAAQRPIIAFGPKDGEVAKVLRETRAGDIFEWCQEEELKERVKELYTLFQKGDHKPCGSQQIISKYSRKSLTEELTKLL